MGRRFKTAKYKEWRQLFILMLPKIDLPEPPFEVWYEFGFSNSGADWDNPVKPTQDALQERYGFNDKHIMRAHVEKTLVKKGEEFIRFKIRSLNEVKQKTALSYVRKK